LLWVSVSGFLYFLSIYYQRDFEIKLIFGVRIFQYCMSNFQPNTIKHREKEIPHLVQLSSTLFMWHWKINFMVPHSILVCMISLFCFCLKCLIEICAINVQIGVQIYT
jgi:hypothetical protein